MSKSLLLKARYLQNEHEETQSLFFEYYVAFFGKVQSIIGKDISMLDPSNSNTSLAISNNMFEEEQANIFEEKIAEEKINTFLDKRLKPIYVEILYLTHPDKQSKHISEKEKKRLTSIYIDCIKSVETSDFFLLMDCADRLYIDLPRFTKEEKKTLEDKCAEISSKTGKLKTTYPWAWGSAEDEESKDKFLQDFIKTTRS